MDKQLILEAIEMLRTMADDLDELDRFINRGQNSRELADKLEDMLENESKSELITKHWNSKKGEFES